MACLHTSPAAAQTWLLTPSGTPDTSQSTSGSSASVWTLPPPSTQSIDTPLYTVTTTLDAAPGQSVSGIATVSVAFGVGFGYQPSPAGETMPSILRYSVSSSTGWARNTYLGAGGNFVDTGSSADDGFGDPPINNTSSTDHTANGTVLGPIQVLTSQPGSLNFLHTLTATSKGTVTAGSGHSGAQLIAKLNHFHLALLPVPGILKVDQDQQVLPPGPTTRFSATVSNASGCVIDWIKISVDGAAPQLATISGTNPNQGYLDWNSSAALNPSEHTIFALAQIHDSIGVVPLDSRRPECDGRAADDVIADLRLQSLDFVNAYTLRNQASASPAPSPDPAKVAEPQFVWNQDRSATPTWNVSSNPGGTFGAPTGQTQSLAPGFYVTPYAFTGPASAGFKMKVQAQSNTTNATTGQPDPSLTLYDNTGTDPVSLPSSGKGIFAPVTLYSKVAKYGLTTSALSLWVKFTGVTPNVWKQVGPSYASASQPLSNVLYAVLAVPKAPMDQPWVGVLDKACDWAKGTADATSATTALTTGFYNSSDYQPGYNTLTTFDTVNGVVVRDFRVNMFVSNLMAGPCYDFADFMVCLSNSIGAVSLQMQTQGSSFTTQKLTRANIQTGPGSNYLFANHAWANGSSKIFDGAIKFGGTSYPANLDGPSVGSTYYNGLVSLPPTAGWPDALSIPYGVKAVN